MAEERYQQQGKPKSGASGDVYKVWDTALEVERAFKRVRVKDDNERQAVTREARLLIKLGSHPNIVQLYDIVEGETYVGLVMDWVEGQTLGEYLQDKGYLGKAEALRIIERVLDALVFAHHHHVLHSDIKPGNVMRTPDGKIRLVDFGVARTLGTHSAGTALGVTYPFAPPEYFQTPYKLDFRADLWAVGVLLYLLVTGKYPFEVELEQRNNPFAWGAAITPCQYPTLADTTLQSLLASVLVPLEKRLPTATAFRATLIPKPDVQITPLLPRRLSMSPLDPPITAIMSIPTGNFTHKNSMWFKYRARLSEPQTERAPVVVRSPTLPIIRASSTPFLDTYKSQMRVIASGSFLMGGDKWSRHKVRLSAFQIGHTPVTVGMWQEFCKATGKSMPELPNHPVWQGGWEVVRDHPMVMVSWNDCKAYTDWADLALPTEAQWEYAARGGLQGKKYPWGDEDPEDQLWWRDTSNKLGTAPVERSHNICENGYCLVDMSGNVCEWCLDWYGNYSKSEQVDPIGPLQGIYRTLRGGSWDHGFAVYFRCAYRRCNSPDVRNASIGFRLCSLGPCSAP